MQRYGMSNPQHAASPIRMSSARRCGRLAQGAAQKERARLWLNGNERIQMRTLQIKLQTLLVELFCLFVEFGVTHVSNPNCGSSRVHSTTPADIHPVRVPFLPPSYCIAAPFSIEPGPPQNSTVSLAGWFFLPRSGYTIEAQTSAGYHAHGFA
jgi:hypothetical protein